MEMPLEFCALRFLLQWERSERKLHEQMKDSPTVDHLLQSLNYFKVARSFKDLSKPSKKARILSDLSEIGSRKADLPEVKVKDLAKRFSSEFGKCNISAASKLLWLSYRNPFVIYDSRAVKALKSARFGCKFAVGNYQEYSRHWRIKYKENEKNIRAAAEQLAGIRNFFPAWHGSKKELLKLVTSTWYLERVFDIYLWELGGND